MAMLDSSEDQAEASQWVKECQVSMTYGKADGRITLNVLGQLPVPQRAENSFPQPTITQC